MDWLNGQRTDTLHLSTITIAEIGYGLQVLPAGKRRMDLENRFERFIRSGFEHRILSFEQNSARIYAHLMAHRRKQGRPMSILDGQIAAIAKAHQCAVATRNLRDFDQTGLELIDPFSG